MKCDPEPRSKRSSSALVCVARFRANCTVVSKSLEGSENNSKEARPSRRCSEDKLSSLVEAAGEDVLPDYPGYIHMQVPAGLVPK